VGPRWGGHRDGDRHDRDHHDGDHHDGDHQGRSTAPGRPYRAAPPSRPMPSIPGHPRGH
jgi:hypothetical protein